MKKPIRILAIDGGGIRGVIPAMVLAEIERRTQRPTCKLFDLMAGTSTGGILALGLAKPNPKTRRPSPQYRAEDMLDLYDVSGPNIFSRSVWHRIRSVGGMTDEKYPSEGIDNAMRASFGNARLKDALIPVLITSYEIERRVPFFFKSTRAKASPSTHDFPMRLAARATISAPTYFEPLKLPFKGGRDYYALVDGGVFANNPAMCAYVEAKTTFPKADDFLLVSLGTGEMTRPLPYDEAKDWGLMQWARQIVSVAFDGVSDVVDYQMRQLLTQREGQDRYYRFQARLNDGDDDMDNASRGNIRLLKLLAEDIIREESDQIDALCAALTAR